MEFAAMVLKNKNGIYITFNAVFEIQSTHHQRIIPAIRLRMAGMY